MTTVILTNFNLEFYFGTQLFVISGVNYLRSHKKKMIKWSGIGLLTSELWWRIHLGTARLCDITIENMSYLRKHSSIMRTTHATNRRGIVPPSQHGRFFKYLLCWRYWNLNIQTCAIEKPSRRCISHHVNTHGFWKHSWKTPVRRHEL